MSLSLERINSASNADCCTCFGDAPHYLENPKIPNYMVAHAAQSQGETRHLIDVDCLLKWTQSIQKTMQDNVPCPICRQWINLDSFDFSKGEEKSILLKNVKNIRKAAEKMFQFIGICFTGYTLSIFISYLATAAANGINSNTIGKLLQTIFLAIISFIVGLGAKENGATPMQGFGISCIMATIGLLSLNL